MASEKKRPLPDESPTQKSERVPTVGKILEAMVHARNILLREQDEDGKKATKPHRRQPTPPQGTTSLATFLHGLNKIDCAEYPTIVGDEIKKGAYQVLVFQGRTPPEIVWDRQNQEDSNIPHLTCDQFARAIREELSKALEQMDAA